MATEPAAKTHVTESELIARAQAAVSHCNWEIGECAALWTKRFARGRTDGDFAQLVGLTADQIYQRRRVWETFGDVYAQYPDLKWSHFYASLTWDDAAECLQWAQEITATVAEMRAWRRVQRGEELLEGVSEDAWGWVSPEPTAVRIPEDAPFDGGHSTGESTPRSGAEQIPTAAAAARQVDGPGEYAPFRPDAMTVPADAKPSERPAPTTEQAVRRLTTTLERCTALFTPEFRREFDDVSEKDRKRFWAAVEQLTKKIDALR